MENEGFEFRGELVNWRKGNEVIGKGSVKDYCIEKGVYVYEGEFNGKWVVVMMKGRED